MTVAALFVQKGGAYYGLEAVDPWDQDRDARLGWYEYVAAADLPTVVVLERSGITLGTHPHSFGSLDKR